MSKKVCQDSEYKLSCEGHSLLSKSIRTSPSFDPLLPPSPLPSTPVDLGEEKSRSVCSGLVSHVPLEEMQERLAMFMCNLKPAK